MAFDLLALREEIAELFEETAPVVFDRRDLWKDRQRFSVIRRRGEPQFTKVCVECEKTFVTRWSQAKTCGYGCARIRADRLTALSLYASKKRITPEQRREKQRAVARRHAALASMSPRRSYHSIEAERRVRKSLPTS